MYYVCKMQVCICARLRTAAALLLYRSINCIHHLNFDSTTTISKYAWIWVRTYELNTVQNLPCYKSWFINFVSPSLIATFLLWIMMHDDDTKTKSPEINKSFARLMESSFIGFNLWIQFNGIKNLGVYFFKAHIHTILCG